MDQDLSASDSWEMFPAGLKVLVVDDDPLCLKVVEHMLRRCNYQVTTCPNGKAALEKLRDKSAHFDLVLSDVYMPDMDGFKLLEHIGLELDLPVIMMSSNGETNVVLRGVTHGAVDFLIKPVRVEELRNVWQHVVRRKRDQVLDAKDSRDISDDEGTDDGKPRGDKKRKERRDSDDGVSAKKARVVWSVEMHQQFVQAVNQLGIDKAVPKRILDLMNVDGLTRENVASHLQKYRLYLKRVSGVHPGMGPRGKGGKGAVGGPDLAFQAMMGGHPGHSMAAGMAAAAVMGGMLPGHMGGPSGVPGRDFMHPMQLQQMGMVGMAHPGLPPGMPGGPAMMPGGPGVSPAGNGRMDLFPHMAQPPVGMQQMPAAHQQAAWRTAAMTMGGLVPGSTMGMVMQGMPAAAMGGQPGVQPNGQYGMAMPPQQGMAFPDAADLFSLPGSLPGMPPGAKFGCGVRSGSLGATQPMLQPSLSGHQQPPPPMQQSSPAPHVPHPGFEMSEIDSGVLYRHHMMSQHPPQQQQEQQHQGLLPTQNGGQQQQQQQGGLPSVPSVPAGLPVVKSEGNMDELLSMFLRD